MNNKRVWLVPLILCGIVVLATGVFGIRAGCRSCNESIERDFQEMVKARAAADYRCLKVKVISGTQDTGIYVADVCGKKRWYKCTTFNGCVDKCKMVK